MVGILKKIVFYTFKHDVFEIINLLFVKTKETSNLQCIIYNLKFVFIKINKI